MNFDELWSEQWGSIHESGHAVAARHFGLRVEIADLWHVRIPHARYTAPDDDNSKHRLIVAAAGDAASTEFCRFYNTGTIDDKRSRDRLRDLGASESQIIRLMADARSEAVRLVRALKQPILTIAAALRHRRVIHQTEIDLLMEYVCGS